MRQSSILIWKQLRHISKWKTSYKTACIVWSHCLSKHILQKFLFLSEHAYACINTDRSKKEHKPSYLMVETVGGGVMLPKLEYSLIRKYS
jgi:hypothetical protein